MLEENSRVAWYAVRVQSRHESSVATFIEESGYEAFAPTYRARRKWCDRVKVLDLPLFPGYVCGRFDCSDRWRIVNLPGVIGLVHFGQVLARIDEQEISALRRVVQAGVGREPAQTPHVGELVEIIGGPLIGLTGPVVRVGDGLRLVLSIIQLHRSVLVHVGASDIRRCGEMDNKQLQTWALPGRRQAVKQERVGL
jgi:transcription antitermination factor NusG